MAPSASSSSATSVQVALRIRPPTQQDSTSIPTRFQRSVIHATSSTSVSVDPTTGPAQGSGAPATSAASAAGTGKKQVFSFDQVHGPPATQHEMFTNTALPLISRFVEGFNCTILAYGQTSSGKTHTMTGVDLDADPSDPHNGMGIIPRSIAKIFQSAKQLRDDRAGAWTFSLKASYIEIYNEDLIDLLTDDTGRREVQIREDKDGHIIWGGLREVPVKNPNEVMALLRKGSSIRRTNETDMNAQSSRSHAIFSLTLTQKKFSGGGLPPRSSSPLPPNSRSPSRLARPGSMYGGPGAQGRVASPTGVRPPTPSFASAMGRGGGLRPSSALGHAGDRSGMDDDGGEWVTIVSKFHFVDLAGSERLKRTAAAGERVKEGISINSGLLALGNVISALGDPSRAKSHMSHIPYRDSKLTRLLQDSLGGNAHTLMIACVSPAEWNVGETVNTLKYANRARNIKNNAVVNAKEDGWDDVEWLQGTVRRLRQELKTIKDGGVVSGTGTAASEPVVVEGAGKKVLAQMTELQNNYEDLREKFVERTEELTRLRRELGERHRGSTGGAIGGTGKYEEIVGPVIEEYEKTISAMEAELNLNRAALRHTNEMVEEKEEELALVTERHSATELYVEELRARVAKLTEREASTEAYVRDLEEKMKTYAESSITSSESMTDLRREVSKYRDSESHSAKYIADLEARLARTDESVLALQQTIEKLESECERRRGEVQHLQSRLETLRDDGDNWRSDLEARERKVRDLEEKMQDWEAKKKEAAATRERLGVVVGEVAEARKSLQLDATNGHSSGSATPSENGTPLASVALVPDAADKHPEELKAPDADPAVQGQLLALQQTHTATLADLASVTAKYRDALREISDLAAQIQEAKLSGHSTESNNPPDSPASETPLERPVEIPPFRRRMTGGRSRESSSGESQYNSAGRRLFFRHAASTESLHGRSLSQSQSLSQELSSVHSRKASFSTSSSHSPSNSHSMPSPFLSPHSRPNLSISLPSSAAAFQPALNTNERSVHSLEKEIMRLQEVLKEREAEIASLEGSLKERATQVPPKTNGIVGHDDHSELEEPTTPPAQMTGNIAPSKVNLSPKTISQFDNIRRSMSHEPSLAINGNGGAGDTDSDVGGGGSTTFSEHDESLERLNELMLSMAQKESQHREVVEDLSSQLAHVRRQHDDLTALSRDQAANMSAEIESLQKKHGDVLGDLEDAKEREADLVQSLEKAKADHALEVEKLQVQVDEARKIHEQRDKEFQQRQVDGDETVQRHEAALAKLTADHAETLKQKEAEAAAALQSTEAEYYNALTKLRADHATALETHAAESTAALERLREEHAAELRMAEIAREGSLTESESSKGLALKELQDAHAAAVSRKETSFGEELKELKAEHARALTTKDEDHALEMDKLRSSHEGLVAKLKEEWRVETEQFNAALTAIKAESSTAAVKAAAALEQAVQEQKDMHASFLRDVEQGHSDALSTAKTQHKAALQAAAAESEKEKAALVAAHAQEMALLNTQHQETITEVNNSVVELHSQHREALEATNARHQKALTDNKTQLSATVEELQAQHRGELETLRKDRDLLANEVESYKAAADEFVLVRDQAKQAHEQSLGEQVALVSRLEQQLSSVHAERSEFEAEVAKLRAELEQTRGEHSTASGERDDLEAEAARLRGELDQSRSAHSSAGAQRDTLESQVAKLQAELERTRSEQSKLIQEASKRESLVGELDRHRSMMADIQENLQRVKDEKDVLQTEKTRSENLVRELQAQMLARSSSPPNGNGRPTDRNYARTTLPPMKLPPPTPPPSVPPPPAPRTNGDSTSSHTSGVTSSSSRDSQAESSATSQNGSILLDQKTAARIEAQSKQIEEQEAMIKTLNKQLTHCESDLQTHMDLVSTLETSLGDSEKNLRKARMHATELARERDTLNTRLDSLRTELEDAKREITNVRNSVVQEKQTYEQRLNEERKAKERARQELDLRMDEMQKRKSKFACL